MGTRSTTKVLDNNGNCLTAMYAQYDGYPEGMGLDLVKFLGDKPLVNGFGSNSQQAFNGPGCLAAQLVAHFKDGIGGFYLTTPDDTQEFNYTLRPMNPEWPGTGQVRLTVESSYDGILYDGPSSEWQIAEFSRLQRLDSDRLCDEPIALLRKWAKHCGVKNAHNIRGGKRGLLDAIYEARNA